MPLEILASKGFWIATKPSIRLINTYKYEGLPPRPINMPDIQTIDAVLNYEKHDYLYFCIKEDFSGSHHFAVNYAQHLKNVKLYQKAWNMRGIK